MARVAVNETNVDIISPKAVKYDDSTR